MKSRKPRQVLSRIQPQMDWEEELARMLIDAGTDGIKQSVVTKRFDKWIEADDVVELLEFWSGEQKVQKFILGGRGRPTTIWRATTLILET